MPRKTKNQSRAEKFARTYTETGDITKAAQAADITLEQAKNLFDTFIKPKMDEINETISKTVDTIDVGVIQAELFNIIKTSDDEKTRVSASRVRLASMDKEKKVDDNNARKIYDAIAAGLRADDK